MNSSKDYLEDLKSFIESGRDSNHRKIAHATYAVKTEDFFGYEVFGIQYHKTVIFGIREDGEFFFNNGGYLTSTTKKRINDALHKCGVTDSIYQHKKIWHFRDLSFDVNARLIFDVNNNHYAYESIESCWCKPVSEVVVKNSKVPNFYPPKD